MSKSAPSQPLPSPSPTASDNRQPSDTSVARAKNESNESLTADEVGAQGQAIDLLTRIKNGFRLPPFESKYIGDYEKWKTEHPTYLKDMFARAEPFLFYIVEEVEKRDMPMEVALLPAVESAFKPRAYSRSSASGLWQFIPSTGRHFGLSQDWWYDGRRDAIAATTAALDYLQELNVLFDGDWLLTFAAYNAGQGTILRAIKKNKKRRQGLRYKDLDLRSETRRYVPKLYAIRNIVEHPDNYGVTLPTIPNVPQFEVVDLPGQIDLARFATMSGIDLDQLKHLNAAHRRWATSPHGPHQLLVPIDTVDQAKEALARIELEPSIEYQHHLIRRGDTLSSIARRYGVSVGALQQVNKIRGTSIRAGKNLLIPIPQQARVAVISTETAPSPVSEQPAAKDNKIVHRVVAGDTLWSIARRYSVKVSQLLSWNKLSANQVLNLNQSLLVFLK